MKEDEEISKVKEALEVELTAFAEKHDILEKIRESGPNQIQRDYWVNDKERKYILIEITRNKNGEIVFGTQEVPPEEGRFIDSYSLFNWGIWDSQKERFLKKWVLPQSPPPAPKIDREEA